MILGLPLVAGFAGELIYSAPERPGRDVNLLVATVLAVFVLATLKSIPDVTQVAQLGRYYLPAYLLAIPTAVAGVLAWLDRNQVGRRAWAWLAASFIALVWADPTWAYDAPGWFQAVPAPLAGPDRGGRLDQEPPRAGSSRRSHHDLEPVGAARRQRSDHDPSAPELQARTDQGSDRSVSGYARSLGLVRSVTRNRPPALGTGHRHAPLGAGALCLKRAVSLASQDLFPGQALPSAVNSLLSKHAGSGKTGMQESSSIKWSFLALVVILLIDLWYRGHTFGPTVARIAGIKLWPAASARPSRSTATRQPMPTSATACFGAT